MSDPAPPSSRWATTGCLTLLALSVGAGFVAAWWVGEVTGKLNPLINKHLESMVKGDWERAHGLMSEEFRRQVPLEPFRSQWSKHPFLTREPEFSAHRRLERTPDHGWVLSGTLRFHDPGAAQARYGLRLGVKPEDDRITWFEWK